MEGLLKARIPDIDMSMRTIILKECLFLLCIVVHFYGQDSAKNKIRLPVRLGGGNGYNE
jgi:hypothetical protein